MQNWFESAHCGNHGVVGLNHVINKKRGVGWPVWPNIILPNMVNTLMESPLTGVLILETFGHGLSWVGPLEHCLDRP